MPRMLSVCFCMHPSICLSIYLIALTILESIHTHAQVVLTVSPVRHLRIAQGHISAAPGERRVPSEGAVNNSLSKSTLICAGVMHCLDFLLAATF